MASGGSYETKAGKDAAGNGSDEASAAVRRRSRWYSPRSVGRSLALRPRVLAGAAVGLAALVLLPAGLGAAVREALAWCLGGSAYLALAFRIMSACTSDRIRSRAARQDDSGVVILVLILLAIFSSFAAIFGLVGEAKLASEDGKLFYVALAATTIVIAWLVMQVAFTLHYAHEYYAPQHRAAGPSEQPLAFPGGASPDYWDFFYFATSFGAASQTSDVMINARALRRLATLHAIMAFFFNTMVLALTINLAASLV